MKELKDKGFEAMELFLDNNTTHKAKMRNLLMEKMKKQDVKFKITFHYIAPYSPKLNLVEYVIHMIRQKVLHHADCKKSLQVFVKEISELCENNEFLPQEMIINILNHIQALVRKNTNLSP